MIEQQEVYSSDSPISDPSQDQFNRWSFAQRIAKVIANRNDPSSIVIGIYGVWGEGKTSVFNFIEHEISEHEHMVCIRFNPWRFGQEEDMLKNFFYDLATAIDRSIETGKERVGGFIKSFVKPVAAVAGYGEAVEGVASFFSNADLLELRQRIEKVLEEEKRRVVILIDDIDRLDKNEIHAVFRLVKLTADFKYTAYVLAFDPDMVATALQERYGAGNQLAGKAFLEKIIQVPLHLPAVETEDLRSYCFDGLNEAIRLSGIQLTNQDTQTYVNIFVTGIEKKLKTPRQARLYSNILTFSLPILSGEVDPVDLMLIEAVRVFYPDVYQLVRQEPDIFLKERSRYGREETEKEKRKRKIEAVLSNYPNEIADGIKEILFFLFPKLEGIFGNTHYGLSWEESWQRKQRICSEQYFQRYFTYSIPRGDISDKTISQVISDSAIIPFDEFQRKLSELISQRNAATFIAKLRNRAKECNKEQVRALVKAIASIGHELPNPPAIFKFYNPYAQGAMLINDLIENLEEKAERVCMAQEVMNTSRTVSFAGACLRWFRRDTEERPNPEAFNSEEFRCIAAILAERIGKEFRRNAEMLFSEDLPFLLYIWNGFGEEGHAKSFIEGVIQEKPLVAIHLLKGYLPTAWGANGVSHKSDFEREQYDAVTKIVDPIIIEDAVKKLYPDQGEIKNYPYYSDDDIAFEKRLAQQFIWIHNYARNHEQSDAGNVD